MIKNIPPGKHAAIIGQNGSGKSQQLMFLARNNLQQVVIFDTKLDDDFLFLASGDEVLQVAESYAQTIELLNLGQFDFLIIRPQDFELAEPEALDNYLKLLANCRNLSIFIDEAYQFHNNGRAGAGYISILTRGRSRKLSLILCTQRPSWVSTFSFSEPSFFFVYRLTMLKDQKKIKEFIPLPDEFELGEYQYYFYTTSEKTVVQCEPVELFTRQLTANQQTKKINILKFLLKTGAKMK